MPAVKPKKKAAAKKKAASRRGPSTRRKPTAGAASGILGVAGNYATAGAAGAVVIAGGVLAVLWAGGYVGLFGEQVTRVAEAQMAAAGLKIRRITLVGRRDAALDEVEAAIGPVIGDSLAHFDIDAARARVEALGWVRSAAVTRLFPDTVHVSVRERTPAAVWQLSGSLHLIDDNGAVIREVGAYEYSSLPLIVGSGAPEAAAELLKALKARPEIERRVAALVRVGGRRWNLRLRSKVDVKLPETGIAEALEALEVMHSVQGTLDRDAEYIDLRDPERVVARPKGAAADASDPSGG